MRTLDADTYTEQAAPATPAASTIVLYAGTDHHLHTLDSTALDVDTTNLALLVHTNLAATVI